MLRCGAAGQDVHASGNYVAGVVLNFAGGLLFSVGKFEQGRPGGPRGAWRWDWWVATLRARGVGITKQAADAE